MKNVASGFLNEEGDARRFTARQEQILDLAGRGFADKEIALKIGVSAGTIRTHWQRMRDKADARSRSEILSHVLCRKHSRALSEAVTKADAYLAMLNATCQGIALLNEYDEVVEANPAFLEMLGIEREEIVGKELGKVPGLKELPSESMLAVEGKTMLHVRRQVVEIAGRAHWVISLMPAFTERRSLSDSVLFA